jgi:hypothetical protein
MKVKFETVIDGINRYIDKEIYKNLDGTQEFLARVVVGRMINNSEAIKNMLITNGFARTLCLIDNEGMVEVDTLLSDIRREIERQGSLQLDIPLMGKLTFHADDVDVLHNEIVR